MLTKDADKLHEAEEYANKAAYLYQQHGSPESAASALHKAAKLVEHTHPDMALRFYQHALEVIMVCTWFLFVIFLIQYYNLA